MLVGKNIKEQHSSLNPTVYPGCTEENTVQKFWKKTSKKKLNKDFLAYSPERINVGDKKN